MGMQRHLVILATAAAIGMAASSAHAHHSHQYFYDACRTATFEGRIESIEFKEPHSLIVVRRDDGAAYTVDWNSLSALTRNSVIEGAKAALVPGARVAVTGSLIRTLAEIREHFPDYSSVVNPNVIDPTSIRRVGGSFSWAAETIPTCKGK